jgi:hypothetical protein
MLDVDGNEQVDKKEFLKVSHFRILMMGCNTMPKVTYNNTNTFFLIRTENQ